ncbi:MFS transporter [Novosphingobium soli]|uniref:MFS transporter n=1 Tax=Novosphingobium soli TaxID=574956 RepID=A0ABV6CZE4_9SPHN
MATIYASARSPQNERAEPVQSGLSARRLAAFSTLAIPFTAAQLPILNFLPAIYAQQFGISLGALGTIFLLERLWGVFADPLVGTLSDRTRSRLGRRRPWIAAGVIVFALAAAALFFPPAGVSPLYLGLALFTFYLGCAMIQIPYLAWSGEISGQYHERTRVATFATVASSSALLLVILLPALIDHLHLGDDRLKLGAMGGFVLLALLPAAWLTLRAFPEAPAREASRAKPLGPLATIRVIAREKLLLRVILSDLAVTFGQGVRNTLLLFVVSIYMGLPEWGATLMLSQYIFGIAAGPIWMQVASRIGKHRAAITGELVQVAINLGLLALTPGNLGLLIALTAAQGLAQGSGNLMLRAMVSDIADQHRLKTGQDRTALFFSAFSISMKAGMALAVGVALPLVGAAGFDPAAAHNSPTALTALLVTFAVGPALAHLCSAALLRGFTLDEAAHAQIRRELDRRAAGAHA